MPTTTTKTVKSSGGDYTSLSSFESNEQADLTASDEIMQAECYDFEDTSGTTFNGWTTDSTRYIRVFGAASDKTASNSGKWATDRYRLVVGGTCIQDYEENFRLEDIQLHLTGTTSTRYTCLLRATGTVDYRVYSCLMKHDAGSATSRYGIRIISATAGTLRAKNNIFYDMGTSSSSFAYSLERSGMTCYLHNNTIKNTRIGYRQTAGTVQAINCIYDHDGLGGANGFSGTFTSSDYNMSSKASDAPGANSKNETTATYVDEGNDDFHLDSTDTAAKDAGTDLSGDSNLAVAEDIDGDVRGASTDMGADEAAGATAGSTNLVCRVTVTDVAGSTNLTNRVTVLLETSTNLVSRVTALLEASKTLVSRVTALVLGSTNLVGRITVTQPVAQTDSTDLVCRAAVLVESSTTLVARVFVWTWCKTAATTTSHTVTAATSTTWTSVTPKTTTHTVVSDASTTHTEVAAKTTTWTETGEESYEFGDQC